MTNPYDSRDNMIISSLAVTSDLVGGSITDLGVLHNKISVKFFLLCAVKLEVFLNALYWFIGSLFITDTQCTIMFALCL